MYGETFYGRHTAQHQLQSLINVKAQTPYKCPYVPIYFLSELSPLLQCFHWLWNLPFDWNVVTLYSPNVSPYK